MNTDTDDNLADELDRARLEIRRLRQELSKHERLGWKPIAKSAMEILLIAALPGAFLSAGAALVAAWWLGPDADAVQYGVGTFMVLWAASAGLLALFSGYCWCQGKSVGDVLVGLVALIILGGLALLLAGSGLFWR